MTLAKVAAAFLIFLLLGTAIPQTKDKQDKKRPAPLTVKLNVLVLDEKVKFGTNLSQDQFRVFEDDVPQTISSFKQTLGPTDYVLAVDCSLSLRNQFSSIVNVAKLFVTNIPAGNEAMLERFISSDKINIEADFTSDKAKLIKALESLYLEGGQSAIVDAVYLANDALEKHTQGKANVRRALVLITDGEDRRSFYTQPQLVKRLHETGLQIFTIGFTREIKPPQKAENFIYRLAQESGGGAYSIDIATDLGPVINEIVLETRAPYVIGYDSTNPLRDGTFRKVRVELVRSTSTDKLVAFARKGYTAPR